jgi:hypothetical protein
MYIISFHQIRFHLNCAKITVPKLDSSSESDSQEEPEGRLSIVSILSSLSDDIPGPTVPPSKPKPKKGPNDIDFLLKNALQTVRMPPKRPVPYYIDDVRGSRHPYCTSGLERMFVYKEDFGKIPQYLQERNVELGRPAVPDFRKFYQNHDCKFYHRHVHCKVNWKLSFHTQTFLFQTSS